MDRLAELRESQALTLRDLAERSGVDANTINQVELGHRKPRPSTLRKLAKALDVEVADFFREPAVPLAEAPQAGRPTIIDVAWDAARRQIARDRQADPRGIADDGPSNEAMRRLREEYGLGGNDAEALVDHMLKDARREENAKITDRLQEREQAHS